MLFGWKSKQTALITGGGPDQDITISGIGTPIAVVCELSRVTVAGTGVDHEILSCGIADGTTQICGGVRGRDAQTTLDTGRMAWSAGLAVVVNPTANTVDGSLIWKQWITDGVRITVTDFPAGAYLATFTFIYGTRANAKVINFITDGVQDQTDTIGGAGFDPTVALLWHYRIAAADPAAASDSLFMHHGIAVNNEGTIEQWSVDVSDRDARSTGHGWGYGIRDDVILQDVTQNSSGTPTFGGRLQVMSFATGTGGITAKTLDSAISFNGMLLLLDTGQNRVTAKIADIDSATSGSSGSVKKITGSSASGLWKPKLVRVVGTNISAP